MIPMPTDRPENPALLTLKAVVFALAGVVMLATGIYSIVTTRSFLARAGRAPGEVVRLNAGGSHPQVRFVTDGGQVVEYPQNGMIWGYRPGDRVTVLYDPSVPTVDPVIDDAGALWGFDVSGLLASVVFELAAWSVWLEGRKALRPPPLPGR